MKNSKHFLFAILALFSMTITSCNEDDLVKEPLDELNSANYWENETNADLALTPLLIKG